MSPLTIVDALLSLGFANGWAANEHGILMWENQHSQPTEAELMAAGWIKPEPIAEEPTE
jgi:hypothetical protein